MSALGPERGLPQAVVGEAVVSRAHDLVPRREPRVVSRPDRRRAEQARSVRLRAQALEERPVPRHDVIGVEPVEPRRLRASDERRVAEHANVGERAERLGPRRGGIAIHVVDVEVGEASFAAKLLDVLCRPRRRATAIRLDVDGDLEPVARRGLLDQEQPLVLRRVEPPPRDDERADAGRSDLSHLREHDLRVRRRVQAAGREVRRRQHRRAVVLDVPVRPAPVLGGRRVPRVVEDRSAIRSSGLLGARCGNGETCSGDRCREEGRYSQSGQRRAGLYSAYPTAASRIGADGRVSLPDRRRRDDGRFRVPRNSRPRRGRNDRHVRGGGARAVRAAATHEGAVERQGGGIDLPRDARARRRRSRGPSGGLPRLRCADGDGRHRRVALVREAAPRHGGRAEAAARGRERRHLLPDARRLSAPARTCRRRRAGRGHRWRLHRVGDRRSARHERVRGHDGLPGSPGSAHGSFRRSSPPS